MGRSTDLAVPQNLVNVQTGEVLPATATNAAVVLVAAREMKSRINDVVAAATAVIRAHSAVEGIRTFHLGPGTVSLTGGVSTEYDAEALQAQLRAAGCPEGRIEEAVVATVSYKVNRSVLKQLSAANPAYRTAIKRAEREVENAYRASVK